MMCIRVRDLFLCASSSRNGERVRQHRTTAKRYMSGSITGIIRRRSRRYLVAPVLRRESARSLHALKSGAGLAILLSAVVVSGSAGRLALAGSQSTALYEYEYGGMWVLSDIAFTSGSRAVVVGDGISEWDGVGWRLDASTGLLGCERDGYGMLE